MDAKCLVLSCSTFLFVIGLTALPPLLARSRSKKAFLIAIRLQSWTYKQLVGININMKRLTSYCIYARLALEGQIRWIRHTDRTNVVYSLFVSQHSGVSGGCRQSVLLRQKGGKGVTTGVYLCDGGCTHTQVRRGKVMYAT